MFSRTYIWPLCLTLWVLTYLVDIPVAELGTNGDFVIGQTTAVGVSVDARIGATYQLVLAGILLFLGSFFLLRKWAQRLETHPLISLIDGLLAFAGLLFILALFQPALKESGQLLLFIAALQLITGYLPKMHEDFRNTTPWLVIGLTIAVNYLLFHSAIIGGLTGILLWGCLQRFGFQHRISLWVSGILIATPFLIFLAVESTLILNQRGMHLGNYWISLILVVCVFAGALYRKTKKAITDTSRFTYSNLVPLALIGIGILQMYSPLIVQPAEMFESANQLNPVMQAELFNEIPLIDNLSSHLTSDFFWVFVYRIFNGYHQDASLLIYVGFSYIIALFCVYYFLKTVWGRSPLVVLTFLLLPAMYFVLPFYYSFALVPVALLYRYVHSENRKYFIFFLLSVALLAFWRLDLGISIVSALVFFLPYWYIVRKQERSFVLKWTVIFGSIGALLLVLFVWTCPLEFEQLKGYFGANQAHGISVLTQEESNAFFLCYYVLPALVTVVMLHTAITFKTATSQALSAIILLLSLFYLFNLQRGLVRHSFIEHNDTQIASFAWLIFALKAAAFANARFGARATLFGGIIAVTTLPLFFSIRPNNGTQNALQREISFSLKDLPALHNGTVNRVVANPEFERQHGAVLAFLSKSLKQNQTFIDFSNTSLLYFYSGKDIPSYFNQYLQNTVSGKLQRINLKEVKQHDIPIIVFSQTPETFYDHTDEVPNKVRYHEITAYIYAHYEPWGKLGSYRLWKRKNASFPDVQIEPYPLHPEQWNLGLLPYYWKANKGERFVKSGNTLSYTAEKNELRWKNKPKGNEFMELVIRSKDKQTLFLNAENLQLQLELQPGKHTYRIPYGCSESLRDPNNKTFKIGSNTPVQFIGYQAVLLTSR